jgi:GDP-L-fucose synthase
MKIVMTGGSGFLLSNLQRRPMFEYIAPRSSEVNWITGDGVDALPYQPDVFIHSAAIYGGLVFNQNYPERILIENMQMSINVMKYIMSAKPIKVISIGSACSYPGNATGKLSEDMIGSGRMEHNVELYAMNKLWMLAASDRLLDKWNHLVLANMYGPQDHLDLEKSHVVGAIMKKVLHAKNNNTDVHLLGTGEAVRSIVYVADACSVIDRCITDTFPNGAYNVGHDDGICIRELANTISDIVDFKGRIMWGNPIDNGAMSKTLNYSKLDNVYADRPKTSLYDGLNLSRGYYDV